MVTDCNKRRHRRLQAKFRQNLTKILEVITPSTSRNLKISTRKTVGILKSDFLDQAGAIFLIFLIYLRRKTWRHAANKWHEIKQLKSKSRFGIKSKFFRQALNDALFTSPKLNITCLATVHSANRFCGIRGFATRCSGNFGEGDTNTFWHIF